MGIKCPDCGFEVGGIITFTNRDRGGATCPICKGVVPDGIVVRTNTPEEAEKLRLSTIFTLAEALGQQETKRKKWWQPWKR